MEIVIFEDVTGLFPLKKDFPSPVIPAIRRSVVQGRLEILAIGDAVVDVIATAQESFLEQEGLVKGSMQVLDAEQATRLYRLMGPAQETSGGSAANTAAGIAALGGRAGFVGQVGDDQLGEVFAHDIGAQGVEFRTPPLLSDTPTGRCLILVTPDAQRTMNTFPGAAHCLDERRLDETQIQAANILYLEAYLWRAERPRAAMRRALEIARQAGRKVAFTLSDIALIERHREDFLGLIDARQVDLLICNEAEIGCLARKSDYRDAIADFSDRVPLLLVTRSEKGALAVEGQQKVEIPAVPVDRVVDTTGAGDLFAAGFLLGQARDLGIGESLRIGSLAAAEIISHFGARPRADLRTLVAA